jgi:hypothetical protein
MGRFVRTALRTGGVGFTPEGGILHKYVNRTGAPSIKGTVVGHSTAYDNSVSLPNIPLAATGIMYDDGIPDGNLCNVVIHGKAWVRIENDIEVKHNYWVGASTVTPGTALATTEPPGGGFSLVTQEHFREIGHVCTYRAAGSTALVLIQLHFL